VWGTMSLHFWSLWGTEGYNAVGYQTGVKHISDIFCISYD